MLAAKVLHSCCGAPLHFCIQVMGSQRSSQTPNLLSETVRQVDEILEELISCSNLDSTKPVMLLSPPPLPPPPPHSALEVRAGLFVNGRIVWLLEGLPAAKLGIIWKEHHGGPFEIRQCSRILSNSDFLELYVRNLKFEQESADGRATEASHLLFKQSGARLKADPILQCLRCLHEFGKGIFGLTLNPRHVKIGAHF